MNLRPIHGAGVGAGVGMPDWKLSQLPKVDEAMDLEGETTTVSLISQYNLSLN